MRLYYGRGRSSALPLLARPSPPLAHARPRGQRVTTAMYYTSWRAAASHRLCAREKGGSCIDALVCFLFCLSCERRACFRFWTAFNNSTVVRVRVRRERAGGRPWQKIGAPQTADSGGGSSSSRRSGSSLERGLRSFSLFTYFTLFSSCLLMGGAYIDSDSAVCVCPNLLPSLPPILQLPGLCTCLTHLSCLLR